MMEPSRHDKAMSNVRVGGPSLFPTERYLGGPTRILNAIRVTTFISFHREKCQKHHQKLFFLQFFFLFYNVFYVSTKYIQVSGKKVHKCISRSPRRFRCDVDSDFALTIDVAFVGISSSI
jgi:hypothetical protein